MNIELKQNQDWLLIANGAPLSEKKLHELAKNKCVMVLDGAYQTVCQAGITPDILLGDFDSIHEKDLAQALDIVTHVVHAPDQNKTDLEKGLEYLDALSAKSIHIASAVGRRLQHTLYNLRILKKYYREDRLLKLISETEIIRYYQNTEVTITGQIKDSIGLLGFPHAVITTSGLTYDVTYYPLDFEKSTSVLNSLAQNEAHIVIQGDVLLIQEIEDESLLISASNFLLPATK